MNKFFQIFKIFLLIFIFLSIRIISDITIYLENLYLYKIIEIILAFLLSFSFCIVFDYNKTDQLEKFFSNLKVSIGYILIFTIFMVLKLIFNNTIFISILNYLSFLSLVSLPFIRDKFIYYSFLFKNDLFNTIIIGFSLLYKLTVNISNIFITIENKYYNLIMIALFIILLYLIKVLIYAFNLKGIIEYDGKEYPVYDLFKVGYLKNSDIFINERSKNKSIFFTITAGKKWIVKPNVRIQIDNKIIEEKQKSEIFDGETIKCMNNYFTIITSKIDFLKKLILSLSLIIVGFFAINSKDKEITENFLLKNQEINIKNIDFSCYPLINIYLFEPLIYENLKNNNLNIKKYIFIVEDEDIKVDLKEIVIEETPVDIVFILDVTGSMYEEYKKIQKKLSNFAYNIKKFRKKIRIGIITFADRPEESQIFNLTDDIDKAILNISNIIPYAGGDYKENPYDAIMRLEEMNFDNNSQKVVILFTDALPHVKNDKADKGKDFTNLTTDDIEKYLKNSPFLFYIVSHERFDEYQRLIDYKKDMFFDIINYDDFSEIIFALERDLTKHIKLSYFTKKSLDFYKKKKRVFAYLDNDEKKVKKIFELKKIKKTSFFNSLFDIW